MRSKKLMFPNKNKLPEETPEEKAERNARLDEEDARIQKHIDLLKEEERLEKEKAERAKKTHRRLTQAQIKRQVKKQQAMAMRMRNIPIDQISMKLGISQATTYELIREAVSEMPEEAADDLKKLLARTIIQLIGNFEQVANEGGTKEAEVMLKAISQMMKLAGLNVQRRQVEQTNMEVGSISGGIDVADLNLDLETKKKLLQAIRDNEKLKQPVKDKPVTEDENEDADITDEDGDSV